MTVIFPYFFKRFLLSQIETLKRTITHSGLTCQEIEALPEETRVYESVGRMFMISNRFRCLGAVTKNPKLKKSNLDLN